MQYGPFLRRYLGSRVIVARKGDLEKAEGLDPNGRDSTEVLAYLRGLIAARRFRADLLLLNCGLHDIKRHRITQAYQVDPAQYRANLRALAAESPLLAEKVAWVSTTPVDDRTHNALNTEFSRYNADVLIYNDIARDEMHAASIPIIDLYSFTTSLAEPAQLYADHVHYVEEIQKLQGAFIAGSLALLL